MEKWTFFLREPVSQLSASSSDQESGLELEHIASPSYVVLMSLHLTLNFAEKKKKRRNNFLHSRMEFS